MSLIAASWLLVYFSLQLKQRHRSVTRKCCSDTQQHTVKIEYEAMNNQVTSTLCEIMA